ncbi:MAG: methyltransferase domain-containing protein [Gorillibacterium sp.]|nr:methyltransferase domain-containing protein [Gorillibacterium sp.]
MDFYDLLSRYYDDIFPEAPVQIEFLQPYAMHQHVLDIGAGTGTTMLGLAASVASIEGLELSAQMVEQGKVKLQNHPRLHLEAGDMRDLTRYQGKTFGFIYCVGNTFVHLESLAEMTSVLQNINELLAPGGILVLQFVNYDAVLQQNMTSLPTIVSRTAPITFKRDYTRQAGKIMFQGTLEYEGKVVGESTVALYPLTTAEMEQLAARTGFEVLEHFGSFKRDAFQVNSSAHIYVLGKTI